MDILEQYKDYLSLLKDGVISKDEFDKLKGILFRKQKKFMILIMKMSSKKNKRSAFQRCYSQD